MEINKENIILIFEINTILPATARNNTKVTTANRNKVNTNFPQKRVL